MKKLLTFCLLTVAFFSCEKNDLVTLDDLRSEAVVWKLESYTFSAGGPPQTIALESDRTLQFWEGRLQSNGSLCNPSGPVGSLEEIDYDSVNAQFVAGSCQVGGVEENITFFYRIDLEAGLLSLSPLGCVEGCFYGYRRVVEN